MFENGREKLGSFLSNVGPKTAYFWSFNDDIGKRKHLLMETICRLTQALILKYNKSLHSPKIW